MKKTLTFVHPERRRRTTVHVGPDLVLVLGGLAAAVAELAVQLDPELPRLGWTVLVPAIALAHARQWRHLRTWPVLASLLLALMSSGMSMLVTGWVLDRWVARRYRDARWKVRDTEGELGEYSSRFLAVDELGFRESDMIGGVVRRHLREGLEGVVVDAPPRPAAPGAGERDRERRGQRRRRHGGGAGLAATDVEATAPSLPQLLARPVGPAERAAEADTPR